LTPRFSRQDARLVTVSRYLVTPSAAPAPRAARSRKAGSFIGTFRNYADVRRESEMRRIPDFRIGRNCQPASPKDHRRRRDLPDERSGQQEVAAVEPRPLHWLSRLIFRLSRPGATLFRILRCIRSSSWETHYLHQAERTHGCSWHWRQRNGPCSRNEGGGPWLPQAR
jgi:hypothetical protein